MYSFIILVKCCVYKLLNLLHVMQKDEKKINVLSRGHTLTYCLGGPWGMSFNMLTFLRRKATELLYLSSDYFKVE